MKIYCILLASVFMICFSCSQKQDQAGMIKTVSVKEVIGTLNTHSNAPPIVTMLTASNAPKVVTAGKPVVIPNPNTDGLGDPCFTYYGTEQGLALENTTCALMDKMGNLWFASWGGGVSRYDGKKFTIYAAANGMDNGILHMVQDSAGNFWFDSGGVLFKYDGTGFTSDTSVKGLDEGIDCLYADKKGAIWFGTVSGAIKYEPPINGQPGKTTQYTSTQGLGNNRVHSIGEDKLGNFWFGTSGGVSRFDGAHFTNYTKEQGLIKNRVTSIETDLSGNTWFGTDSGVSKFDGSHFTNYTKKQGLVNNSISAIKADRFGVLWFGTDSGVSKYEIPGTGMPGIFTSYTKINGLSDNIIKNITEDQTGNIWFGTERGGICKYNRNNLTEYTTSLGLAGNVVKSIIQDKAGNFWFGTEGNGVSKYDGKKFTNYTVLQGLPDNNVYSMLQDKAGNIWFGCYGAISKFDGKSFTNYDAAQGISNAEVWNMMEDKAGNLWFTSWFGVNKFDGKSFSRYTEAQGLANNQILSVIQDRKGNIWFSARGVNKFDGTHFTNYTSKNGLLLDEIPGLMEDAEGNIWFGFYGKGVSKFRDNLLTTYTTTQGIADNTVFKIREDAANHRIWFATNSGLSVLKQNAQSSSGADTIVFENFNYKTGFEIKDFSFNFSLFIDNKGIIWGGSGDRKLIRFDYNNLSRNNKSFQLQLQNIAINNENICWNILRKDKQGHNISDSPAVLNEMIGTFGKVFSGQESKTMADKYQDLEFDSISRFYPIPQNLVLPYKMNNINFEFAAIQPAVGNQIKYQYLLEGYGQAWSPLTNKTNASFGNIHEGTYTFRLKALNPEGVWSETTYSFKVLSPWYRTWWAYTIYALLFLGALRIFSKWRERNLRGEKEKLEIKVEERTNELKGTLENLKATQTQLIQSEKMASLGELTAGIAHEIQNPLNFVNNFSDVNKELLAEMKEEIDKGHIDEVKAIANDVIENEEKINHHGKRADSIVKGMLQHSRRNTGKKELTNINALAEEYLRLAYHGLRAKDKSFNATLITDYDENAGALNIIPQDIGRVLLNIYNNAFYAVTEKRATPPPPPAGGGVYEPTVFVTTQKISSPPAGGGGGATGGWVTGIEISIKDNGTGIPGKVVDKIFQPFFTTKPTGQGTGLGLSLSYDIIKAHGGTLKVETKENEYTEFIISLPVQ